MKQNILDLIKQKNVLVLDGAMGSNLQSRGLDAGTPSEKWLLEKPEEIQKLQSEFVQAGSDVLLTCTFMASPIGLKQHALADKMSTINTVAVETARKVFGSKPSIVAGSIGPCGQMLQPYGTLSEEDLIASITAQAKALIDAGVNLLVIETQFDLNEAAVGVESVRKLSKDIFLVVSFSYDRGRKTMMGVAPKDTTEKFNSMDVDALGINCGKSVEDSLENLKELASHTDKLLWFKPNAGLPQTAEDGSSQYVVNESEYKGWMVQAKEIGASFIGGCCGTSPTYLGYIASAVQG